MSKIVIALLMAAAFIYAVWLVLFQKELPDARNARGFKRRFVVATLLFAGLITASSAMGRSPRPNKGEPQITCYEPGPNTQAPTTQPGVADTLKTAWRTLDPANSQKVRQIVDTFAANKSIRYKTADMLAMTYSELALHKKRTRGKGPQTTCYVPLPGISLIKNREKALKQIELLAKARQSGAIDPETANKAHAVLAREIQMMTLAKDPDIKRNISAQEKLLNQYKAGQITAGDAASVTAAIIVEMEDGKVTELTPAKRLEAMKQRVNDVFTGESGMEAAIVQNDWLDPALNPNMQTVLYNSGLISSKITMRCYMRPAGPPEERSEELKQLQAELLDKNVRIGVLDVETAEKAAQATSQQTLDDTATENDIADYQKNIQRAVRLLYKKGELSSNHVEQLEQAIDMDIIAFNHSKALRNDFRWYFRSAFWLKGDCDEILKLLEKRNLIPPALNHRMMMKWPWTPDGEKVPIIDERKQELIDFEKLIDGDGQFAIDGDETVLIKKYTLPNSDLDYRLKMRIVCRALMKTGLVSRDDLKNIEELIGIPLLGQLEKR